MQIFTHFYLFLSILKFDYTPWLLNVINMDDNPECHLATMAWQVVCFMLTTPSIDTTNLNKKRLTQKSFSPKVFSTFYPWASVTRNFPKVWHLREALRDRACDCRCWWQSSPWTTSRHSIGTAPRVGSSRWKLGSGLAFTGIWKSKQKIVNTSTWHYMCFYILKHTALWSKKYTLNYQKKVTL